MYPSRQILHELGASHNVKVGGVLRLILVLHAMPLHEIRSGFGTKIHQQVKTKSCRVAIISTQEHISLRHRRRTFKPDPLIDDESMLKHAPGAVQIDNESGSHCCRHNIPGSNKTSVTFWIYSPRSSEASNTLGDKNERRLSGFISEVYLEP